VGILFVGIIIGLFFGLFILGDSGKGVPLSKLESETVYSKKEIPADLLFLKKNLDFGSARYYLLRGFKGIKDIKNLPDKFIIKGGFLYELNEVEKGG